MKPRRQLDLEEVIADVTYEQLAIKIYRGTATKEEEQVFAEWSNWHEGF